MEAEHGGVERRASVRGPKGVWYRRLYTGVGVMCEACAGQLQGSHAPRFHGFRS